MRKQDRWVQLAAKAVGRELLWAIRLGWRGAVLTSIAVCMALGWAKFAPITLTFDWKSLQYMVAALAWPAFAGFLIYLFRSQIVDLFGKLNKVKIKNFELELSSVQPALEEEARTQGLQVTGHSEVFEEYVPLLEVHPASAIVLAWARIEDVTKRAAQAAGIGVTGNIAGTRTIQSLVDSGKVSETILKPYGALRRLRNAAAHDPNAVLDFDTGAKYLSLASELFSVLEKVANEGK